MANAPTGSRGPFLAIQNNAFSLDFFDAYRRAPMVPHTIGLDNRQDLCCTFR